MNEYFMSASGDDRNTGKSSEPLRVNKRGLQGKLPLETSRLELAEFITSASNNSRPQRSQTFTVRTASDARSLLNLPRGLHWNIVLDLPTLHDARVQARYEVKARRLVNACGCPEGAFAALSLAVAMFIFMAQVSSGLGLIGIIGLAALGAIVGFMAGAVVGKLGGLWLARQRLKNLVTFLSAYATDSRGGEA